MFEFLKTVGLLKLFMILMRDLGDEQERKGCGFIVVCLCVEVTRGQLCLVWCVNLTQLESPEKKESPLK